MLEYIPMGYPSDPSPQPSIPPYVSTIERRAWFIRPAAACPRSLTLPSFHTLSPVSRRSTDWSFATPDQGDRGRTQLTETGCTSVKTSACPFSLFGPGTEGEARARGRLTKMRESQLALLRLDLARASCGVVRSYLIVLAHSPAVG